METSQPSQAGHQREEIQEPMTTNDKLDKLGDLADRLSILELREFMGPRFRGHKVKDGTWEEVQSLRDQINENVRVGREGEIATLTTLNTRIWMLLHVEEEIAKNYGTKPEALTAVGMIRRLVSAANNSRAAMVAKLNGEAMRKIY